MGIKKYKDKKLGHGVISIVIMTCLILMFVCIVNFTNVSTIYAAPDAKVYMWLEVDWEDGTPLPGQPGDLYNQLQLMVKHKNSILYEGPMGGLESPKDVTNKIDGLAPGKTITLDFTVHLPGPQTGNEFQGSTMSTSFLVHTQCITSDGKDVILKPILEPNNMLFNLSNLNPGDRYDKSLIIKIPELPETAISEKIVEVLGLKPFLEVLAFTGIHPAIIISSIALILMGSILVSLSIRRKKRALPKQL